MSFVKFSLVFVALFAVALASSATWGKRNSTDVLLLNEAVVRTPLYNSYISVDVRFPKNGQTNTRTISAIIVTDRFTNSSGAYPALWSGGVGYRFATINLKSQYGRGINSTVQVWGK